MLQEQLAAILTYERDKSQWFTKTLKLLYSGGLGPNTLYLDSELRTPVTLLGLKKSAMVIDKSFQCILLEQWIKLNVSPYLGDWDPYYGTGTHLPVLGILSKNLISGTIQQKTT